MSSTEKTLKVSLLSTELGHQALMTTLPKYCKEPVSPQSSLSDFSQNTPQFTEVNDSFHGSNASLNDEMEIHETSTSAPLTVIHDSKTPQKNKNFAADSSESPKRKYNILTNPPF